MKCTKHPNVELVKTDHGWLCPECMNGSVPEEATEPVTVYDCPVHGKDVTVFSVLREGIALIGPVCATCLDAQLKAALPKLIVRTEMRAVQSAKVDEAQPER